MALNVGYKKWFFCESCNDEVQMDYKKMVKHLKKVHNLKEPFKGKRELFLHINRQPRHISVYRWNIEGVLLSEHNS